MKNQYFKKDKKAQVYRKPLGYKDEYGVYHKGGVYPISSSSLWCYARQNSQSLSFGSGVAYVNEERAASSSSITMRILSKAALSTIKIRGLLSRE